MSAFFLALGIKSRTKHGTPKPYPGPLKVILIKLGFVYFGRAVAILKIKLKISHMLGKCSTT
jgi:hypothetical protein